MAASAGTTGISQARVLDLSGVPLGELSGVDGLSTALASLRRQLARTAAPLCSGDVSPPCQGSPSARPGTGNES
ncbi:hypothetical protein [Streptomyces finlayi]|uniref:hypothetical protein n=1 Tax=Streptomyces finlayi TaxID=67296 RepID=UPI0016748368|nr:hypothetical protein [Streptomyces finlayi]